MKKLFAVIICAALALSLVSCSKGSPSQQSDSKKKKPANLPAFSEEVYEKDFADSSGKTAARLEFRYPAAKKNVDEAVAEKISAFFSEKIADAEKRIEKNADNISDYLTRLELEGPEVTLIECSTYSISEQTASFLLTTRVATNPEEVEPSYEGITFSLADGCRLSIPALAKINSPEVYTDTVKEAIVEQANYTYSSNGVMLSDEKIEIFNNLYKDNSFVSDGDNVVFVYSYAELSGGTRTGAYYCEVDMTALEDIIISPDGYGLSVKSTALTDKAD